MRWGGVAWPTGLARLPLDARAFYGTIAASTLVGVLINFVDIDPIKALFWSAVLNGVVAVPLMVIIMFDGDAAEDYGTVLLPRLCGQSGGCAQPRWPSQWRSCSRPGDTHLVDASTRRERASAAFGLAGLLPFLHALPLNSMCKGGHSDRSRLSKSDTPSSLDHSRRYA